MTNAALMSLIAERSPSLEDLRDMLRLRSVASARERVWPLVEIGRLDFTTDLRLIVRQATEDKEYAPRKFGRKGNGPYQAGRFFRVHLVDENKRTHSRSFPTREEAQRTIAEWELGGDLPGQYARTSRTLSGADLIPCTRCRLRGHTAGDPDKCYQPVSFGLGQWADEPAVSVSGKKGGAP
jgi:hypothetical protein